MLRKKPPVSEHPYLRSCLTQTSFLQWAFKLRGFLGKKLWFTHLVDYATILQCKRHFEEARNILTVLYDNGVQNSKIQIVYVPQSAAMVWRERRKKIVLFS